MLVEFENTTVEQDRLIKELLGELEGRTDLQANLLRLISDLDTRLTALTDIMEGCRTKLNLVLEIIDE